MNRSKDAAPQVNPIVAKAAALVPIRKNMWKHRRDPEQLTLFTSLKKDPKR